MSICVARPSILIRHELVLTVLFLDQALHGGSQHLLIQLHGDVVVLGDVLLGTFQLAAGFRVTHIP